MPEPVFATGITYLLPWWTCVLGTNQPAIISWKCYQHRWVNIWFIVKTLTNKKNWHCIKINYICLTRNRLKLDYVFWMGFVYFKPIRAEKNVILEKFILKHRCYLGCVFSCVCVCFLFYFGALFYFSGVPYQCYSLVILSFIYFYQHKNGKWAVWLAITREMLTKQSNLLLLFCFCFALFVVVLIYTDAPN